MGLFDKAKKAAQQAFAQPQQGEGMVHVQGAGPIDPAVMGGPSTRSVAADDRSGRPSTASRCRTTPVLPVTRSPAVSTTRQA
jgi:hypothetical protein